MARAKALGDQKPSQKGPIPLFVGVTGHRNVALNAIDELKDASRRALISLMRESGHTRIIVLSPLCEGADRIVAEAALDLGLELVCPLPMPEHLYVKDFNSHSVPEFYRLLGQSTRHFVVPYRGLPLDHERRYEALAAYMVQASDVLIALWDGKPGTRIAGTAKTVEFKVYGVPKPYDPDRSALDIPDTGPVYHIVTPRQGESLPDKALTLHVHWPIEFRDKPIESTGKPIEFTDKKYKEIFKKLDKFNEFAAGRDCAAVQHIDDVCFKMTDDCAQRLRTRTGIIRIALFWCIGLSFLFFELYRPDGPRLFGGLYFALFFLAAVMVGVTQLSQLEATYLDYRALAEACRIQSFWHSLYLHDGVADHYLHKQRGQVQWIRKALRSLCTFVEIYRKDVASPPVTIETIRALKDKWVQKELVFFTEHTQIDKLKDQIAKWVASILAFGSVGAALAAFVWHKDTLFWSPILAAIAALVHTYADKCAWAQHAREYSRMRTVYANADSTLQELLLAKPCEAKEAIKLFRDLGNEALAENGDWFLVHRERRIDGSQVMLGH